VRSEEDEANPVLGEEIEGFGVDSGFRQPHAIGQALETAAEVGNAPANLRDAVAGGGQRHDEVVVDLRHGRSVAGKALLAALVSMDDGIVNARSILAEPGEQGRPEVEAHARVVVEDADDLVLLIDNAGGAVGRVTLRGDAVVPVVPGRRGFLSLDGLEPRVLARRLIEMAVDTDGFFGAAHGFSGRSILKYMRLRSAAIPGAQPVLIGRCRLCDNRMCTGGWRCGTIRENFLMFDNLLKPEHLIIILVIALLIFGPSKLPGLGKGLGEAFRGFKEGIKGSPDNPDAAKQQENTAAKSENATTQVK
jgi:sec-independent protein translocase protein TatA